MNRMIGLINHGNSCYANSVIQLLAHNSAAVRLIFLEQLDQEQDNATNSTFNSPQKMTEQTVKAQLQYTLAQLCVSHYPVKLIQLGYSMNLSLQSQEDANEFLKQIQDKIDFSMRQNGEQSIAYRQSFEGNSMQIVTCNKCNSSSCQETKFCDMIPVAGEFFLKINELFNDKTVDQYNCTQCNSTTQQNAVITTTGTISNRITYIPDCFFISPSRGKELSRFKNLANMEVPLYLDMTFASFIGCEKNSQALMQPWLFFKISGNIIQSDSQTECNSLLKIPGFAEHLFKYYDRIQVQKDDGLYSQPKFVTIPPDLFRLTSVVCHKGKVIGSGHYVNIVVQYDPFKIYLLNDSVVEQVSINLLKEASSNVNTTAEQPITGAIYGFERVGKACVYKTLSDLNVKSPKFLEVEEKAQLLQVKIVTNYVEHNMSCLPVPGAYEFEFNLCKPVNQLIRLVKQKFNVKAQYQMVVIHEGYDGKQILIEDAENCDMTLIETDKLEYFVEFVIGQRFNNQSTYLKYHVVQVVKQEQIFDSNAIGNGKSLKVIKNGIITIASVQKVATVAQIKQWIEDELNAKREDFSLYIQVDSNSGYIQANPRVHVSDSDQKLLLMGTFIIEFGNVMDEHISSKVRMTRVLVEAKSLLMSFKIQQNTLILKTLQQLREKYDVIDIVVRKHQTNELIRVTETLTFEGLHDVLIQIKVAQQLNCSITDQNSTIIQTIPLKSNKTVQDIVKHIEQEFFELYLVDEMVWPSSTPKMLYTMTTCEELKLIYKQCEPKNVIKLFRCEYTDIKEAVFEKSIKFVEGQSIRELLVELINKKYNIFVFKDDILEEVNLNQKLSVVIGPMSIYFEKPHEIAVRYGEKFQVELQKAIVKKCMTIKYQNVYLRLSVYENMASDVILRFFQNEAGQIMKIYTTIGPDKIKEITPVYGTFKDLLKSLKFQPIVLK